MNVFETRNQLIDEYESYISSFVRIRDDRIATYVRESLAAGVLWPEPLIQLNPSFEPGEPIDELIRVDVLHPECGRVFRRKQDRHDAGSPFPLHRHQSEAIRAARRGENYVLTTGTGSGKSLAYIVPIVDHVLRRGSGCGVQAVVVYPMNALANSQQGELEKFLQFGYPDGKGPVTFARYTGQESDDDRQAMLQHPPDIILTNYVMLELMMTRPYERPLMDAAAGLRFLVLDELHTYRGRQGADVALLVRRVRDRLAPEGGLQIVGTSATLADAGTYDEQRRRVAAVAERVFGAPVRPDNVIGETLRRVTAELDPHDAAVVDALRQRVAAGETATVPDFDAFIADPLSSWIESTFGVTREGATGRLIRSTPRSLTGDRGAARELAALTGLTETTCADAIAATLLAGYRHRNPAGGFPAFAFRLHQFIGKGDAVYASLEAADQRHITVYGQQFKPDSRDHVLLPLVFCRECGESYFCVRRGGTEDGRIQYVPRELGDRLHHEDGEAGFLHYSATEPWPEEAAAILERLPEDWVEDLGGRPRVIPARRKDLPLPVEVLPDGSEGVGGLVMHWAKAPFRFCLTCGVAYDTRQGSDFAKLAPLSSEGRSTATTILSMTAVQTLRDSLLDPRARKLLSFTDNRQDAALQSGHFNDFVEVGLLRAALYRTVHDAGEAGIDYTSLTQRVFAALKLPVELYAVDPEVKFAARKDTDRALREVLGYRLYRDLKRGWRITSPNLEQCGLLRIHYESLDELCADESEWAGLHGALVSATPEERMRIARTLLDYMRRELAIKVDYLDQGYLERVVQGSNQRLREPWALDEDERLEYATVLYPRPRRPGDDRGNTYLSAHGGFGQYLRRPTTLPRAGKLNRETSQQVIADLLRALQRAGLVECVDKPTSDAEAGGYQLPAGAMVWRAGDGTAAFRDPIRVPSLPAGGGQTNRFFVDFYRSTAAGLLGLRAREHTAQVPYEQRQEREQEFRLGTLPVLYCSPTMELGVDISELNVVNMRNVPPTPANYAQRSGRAGRSGQPALVFTYCTTGSPHDQYFFKRPEQMVAGAVTPPRLDLANEDLVRSHVQAIWLAETGQSLGRSLKDLLDLTGEPPSLELLPEVRDSIAAAGPRARARTRAAQVLATLGEELTSAPWYSDTWLDRTIDQFTLRFDEACERWRGLYRAAMRQREVQNRIIGDASRLAEDKNQAKRLRREAEAQLDLLTEVGNVVQSDFYSYRYFASEGFLPGYSFPRLPISAFVPARRTRQRDEFLSRPRFLAISEFGPRAVVYHEGSRYVINQVIMPVADDNEAPDSRLSLREAKLCQRCGYLHPIEDGVGPDLCEHCGAQLDSPLKSLFRMQNVSTRRRERINSDEEERLRLGYELLTSVRFAEHDGRLAVRSATVSRNGTPLATLTYGSTATLWRVNLGWTRRKNKAQHGFILDVERGYWARNDDVEIGDPADPMSPAQARVVPFVEDRRNCLLLRPAQPLDAAVMAGLQAALKSAIQVVYQLEDNELAAEPLPSATDRRVLLLYESAEGGAGVLRRLAEHPPALRTVARMALEICHFDPATGEDLGRAPRAREACVAACYDCLMTYANQRDHQLLDRLLIRDLLLDLAGADVAAAPAAVGRAEHLQTLSQAAGSDLERRWLQFLETHQLRLPTRSQVVIAEAETRPDFVYDEQQTVIYVDGPIHDYPDRQARDQDRTRRLRSLGYSVLRFRHDDEWADIVAAHPHIFGKD